MKTQVKIMGLDVDIITIRNLAIKIRRYLTNDNLNVIVFASTHLIEEIDRSEELKELIGKSDLILPQDETLLSLHHVDELKEASIMVGVQYISSVFDKLSYEKRSAYILVSGEKEAMGCKEWIAQWYPNIQIIGSYYKEIEQNKETVINEINSLVPDMLLCFLNSPEQERFLLENKAMINAKLGIALGNDNLGLIKKFKQSNETSNDNSLKKLYNQLIENKGITKLRNIRMFKRKVENYKNKKGGKSNGDNE